MEIEVAPPDQVVNLLLVDDQPANLLALQEVLRPLAQNLVAARSGEEALRCLLDQEFALILLDVKMPGMDGIETARMVRQRDKSRGTPIIFLTAFDHDSQETIRGYALGAVDFLAKPIVPEVLRSKVAVFVELYRKTEQLRRQADLLRDNQRKEHEGALAQERQRWEMERLRDEATKEKKNAEKLTEIVAERTLAEQLLRQRVRQQALVAALGQQALAGAELDPLIQEIVLQVARSLDVEYAVILELMPDHKALRLHAGVGWKEDVGQHVAIADWTDAEALYALGMDQSTIVGDLRSETRFDGAALLQHGVISGLTVIIRNHDHPFGALGAHSRRERTFTQDDVNFLQAIANVLAAAIQRRRSEHELSALKDQLADQLEDMTQLHKLSGRLLNSKLDLQALVEEVLKAVTELQETTMGVCLLYHPEDQGRYTMASIGLGDASVGPIRPADLREPVIVEDVESDPRFAPHLAALQQAGYRSLHATPLQTRAGRTIGSATVFFPHPHRPSETQLRMVELYARLAAEAIDNARLYQEIQESNRRKDEFLAMLAHELRNPLAPIRNALEILRLRDSDAATRERAREMADRQAQHMSRLVDDLLDVSRISRGKIQLNKKAVEIGPIIERAVESTRPLFEAHGLTLDVQALEAPVWLEADPTRVEQVLVNLLNNAAKYTMAGGRVWVGAEADADCVTLRVRDTGIGIAPELLPRVFDMFVQAEGSLDRSQGGLGIGLTLVRSLVSMHEGTVEARSEGPGKGSEFIVRLPRLRKSPAAAPVDPSVGDAPTKPARRVLVVDDNVDAAESLAFLLRTDGHEVDTAYDGVSALEKAHRLLPDVVLLDIGLPGMSGHEVAGRLRQEHRDRSLLLIALTGYGQEEDRRRSQEVGIDAHLTKPVDLPDLQALLVPSAANP